MKLPIVLWNGDAPDHEASEILVTQDRRFVVVGSHCGKMCFWDFDEKTSIARPRSLAVSGTSPVVALAECWHDTTNEVVGMTRDTSVVCVQEDGTVSVWDPRDGLCLQRKASLLPGAPTDVCVVGLGRFLACAGHFPNVLVLDLTALSVRLELHSQLGNDWASCCAPFETRDANGHKVEYLASVSPSGVLSLHQFLRDGRLVPSGLACKSVQLASSSSTRLLRFNSYHCAQMLLLTPDAIDVYSLPTLTKIASMPQPSGHLRWSGATFVQHDRFVAWTKDGFAAVYKVPDEVEIPAPKKASAEGIVAEKLMAESLLLAELPGDEPTPALGPVPEPKLDVVFALPKGQEQEQEQKREQELGNGQEAGEESSSVSGGRSNSSSNDSVSTTTANKRKFAPLQHRFPALTVAHKRTDHDGWLVARGDGANRLLVWGIDIMQHRRQSSRIERSKLSSALLREKAALARRNRSQRQELAVQAAAQAATAAVEGQTLVTAAAAATANAAAAAAAAAGILASDASSAPPSEPGSSSVSRRSSMGERSSSASSSSALPVLKNEIEGIEARAADGILYMRPLWYGSLSDTWPSGSLPVTNGRANTAFTTYVNDSGHYQIALGFEDGLIACAALSTLCWQTMRCKDPSLELEGSLVDLVPDPFNLVGHEDKVTCLLVLPRHPTLLVSGSADFSVRVWDTTTFCIAHCFRAQCGEILELAPVPDTCSGDLQHCVVAIARDHSVAIYALEPEYCVRHLIGAHPFPVRCLRWQPAQDFLVVGLTDGSVFVWELGTGHLDARESGQRAEDILANSPIGADKQGVTAGPRNSLFSSLVPRSVRFSGGRSKALVLLLDVEPFCALVARSVIRIVSQSSIDSDLGSPPSTPGGSDESAYVRLISGFVLSALHAWDVDSGMDAILSKSLRLGKVPLQVTVGALGAAGATALPVPGAAHSGGDGSGDGGKNSSSGNAATLLRWKLSSRQTTKQLLAIAALAHARSRTETDGAAQAPWLQAVTFYTVQAVEGAIRGMGPRDCRLLAAYWEHGQYDVKKAARTHLLNELHRMRDRDCRELCAQLSTEIPDPSDSSVSDAAMAATSLLGVIMSETKVVLTQDLCLRLARVLAGVVASNKFAVKHRCTACDVFARCTAVFSEHMDVRNTLVRLIVLSGTSPSVPAPLSTAAALACGQIAGALPELFVDTISKVVLDTRESTPAAILKVIRKLVMQQPLVLLSQLSKMVDLIVRCIDPTVPRLREQCFKVAGSIIRDMVAHYPMVSSVRLANAQRLAVGDNDGYVTVYDLRTGTRWQHFQSHNKPITAVSIAPDGKVLASYCVHEQSVKIFAMTGSLFGIMSSSARCTKTYAVTAPGTVSMSDLDLLEKLTLSWTSQKDVTLLAPEIVHMSFTL